MSPANLLMLGFAVAALLVGLVLLTRGGGSEAGVYARRIAGTMLVALGIFLAIFAFGLSEPVHA